MSLFKKIFISALIGIILGYALPDYILPFEKAIVIYAGLLKIISAPLISLMIISFIVKYSLKAKIPFNFFLLISSLIMLVTSLAIIIGYETWVVQEHASRTPINISAWKLDIFHFIPTNLISPFLEYNMPQIILISILFGLLIRKFQAKMNIEKSIDILQSFFIYMLKIIINLSPYIFGFVTALFIGKITDQQVTKLSDLFWAITISYLIQYIIFTIAIKISGITPNHFLVKSLKYQLVAFVTGSSKSAIPNAIEVIEKDFNVRPEYSSVYLPIISSLNMIGLSVYIIVIVLYMANTHNLYFSTENYLMLLGLAYLSPIGVAGVPGGALSIMPAILSFFNFDIESNLILLITIDPLINNFRTVMNITGDVVLITIVNNLRSKK